MPAFFSLYRYCGKNSGISNPRSSMPFWSCWLLGLYYSVTLFKSPALFWDILSASAAQFCTVFCPLHSSTQHLENLHGAVFLKDGHQVSWAVILDPPVVSIPLSNRDLLTTGMFLRSSQVNFCSPAPHKCAECLLPRLHSQSLIASESLASAHFAPYQDSTHTFPWHIWKYPDSLANMPWGASSTWKCHLIWNCYIK